jgi:hypothetical protein
MAVIVTVRATASGRCWKQHGCVACGGTYRYLFERSVTSRGRPGDPVETWAREGLARQLEEDFDDCPCPTCGSYQPDMVARSKVTWHLTLTILAVVLLLLLLILTFSGVMPLDAAGKVTAAVAGFTAFFQLITALSNPNRNRARNLRKIKPKLTAGTLEVVQPGDPACPHGPPRVLTPVHLIALLAIVAAPLAFYAVVAVSDENPLPRNAGLQPDVVGPGTEVTIPLPFSTRTYAGNWRGLSPTATVLNAAELVTPATLPASSHKQHWGKITAVNDKKHPFEAVKPWIRVSIPDNADLGGKTMRLKVSLEVNYPTQGGSNNAEKTTVVEKEVAIALAEAGTGALYRQTWDIGKWVGVGCCLLGGLALYLLAQRMKQRALPHQALPMWAPGDGRVIAGVRGL